MGSHPSFEPKHHRGGGGATSDRQQFTRPLQQVWREKRLTPPTAKLDGTSQLQPNGITSWKNHKIKENLSESSYFRWCKFQEAYHVSNPVLNQA
ncbi:hypothetical protein HID58_074313, partial [Brassica napus]